MAIEAKFSELQFVALRQEIESAKERAFRVYTIGALILPAAQQLFQYLAIIRPEFVPRLAVLRALLPFFVLTIMFLYLAEDKAIKRCGRYIRENIDPVYLNGSRCGQPVVGWETWLTTNASNQYAAASFYVLFMLYYVGFSCLALADIYQKSLLGMVIALLVYLLAWLAVQCIFLHDIFYSEGSKCPIHRTMTEHIPNYLLNTRLIQKLVEWWNRFADALG